MDNKITVRTFVEVNSVNAANGITVLTFDRDDAVQLLEALEIELWGSSHYSE